MAGRKFFYALAAAGLFSLVAVAIVTVCIPSQPTEDLSWMTPQVSLRFRLYSGEADPVSGQLSEAARAVEIIDSNSVATKRFVVEKDKSTEVQILKADGEHLASSQSFFREASPGAGLHPHVARTFSTVSDIVLDEQVVRYDGSLAEHTTRNELGGKTVLDYGMDGIRKVRELIILPREQPYLDPVLKSDQRWRDDAANSLSFSNVINADKTRTLTDWDASAQPTKILHMPEYGVNGATAQAWYPGTHQLRMEAKATSEMVARYLRPDGTLDYILSLSTGMTTIDYFDPTGTKKILQQMWWREDKVVDGVRTSTYKLYYITEMTADGEKARELSYQDGKLTYIDVYNPVIRGQKYAEVDYVYEGKTNTLQMVRSWIAMGHGADLEEPHTPAENIRPPAVPPSELKMNINPDLDMLPIPPPQRGPEG